MASCNPSQREQICRLAGQISCQSLQLRDIVDNIYQRGQSPSRPPSAARSSPPGFAVTQSVSAGKGAGGRKASAAPKMRKGSKGQFLTVQVPVSMASQFVATQKLDTGELSARLSVSSLGSDEGPKIPTTSHISRRPKPRPPPKPKAEEPEPAHPRPYEDDPIWEVWESNMLRLTQLLKMLLQELRSVTEYTKIDEPTLLAAAGVVGSGVPFDRGAGGGRLRLEGGGEQHHRWHVQPGEREQRAAQLGALPAALRAAASGEGTVDGTSPRTRRPERVLQQAGLPDGSADAGSYAIRRSTHGE
ncbi:hypothetical protein MTO96_024251 [Rhipicephalus appendiculatus]